MNASAHTSLRLHWWRAVPNFGDALSPMIVGHMSGREVVHVGPRKAELFAIGSLIQVVRRALGADAHRDVNNDERPGIWGSGLLHKVGSLEFLQRLTVHLVRGPRTAALLGLEAVRFGDAGLLAPELFAPAPRTDRIGVMPHHSQKDDPAFGALIASDPAFVLIDPAADVAQTCAAISSCAHVLSSSLHGLIVADAYGVPNTWIDPGAQKHLKYQDYADAVGRDDMSSPRDLSELVVPSAARITYQDGIDACRAALHDTFPKHLKAA